MEQCRKMAPVAANVENIDENTFFSQMIHYCVTNYIINPLMKIQHQEPPLIITFGFWH